MSQTNIAITQLVQVGLAERSVQEAQLHPEIARHTAQGVASAELQKQKNSVAKTEDSEASRSIKAKKEGEGDRGGHGGKKRRKHLPQEEAEREVNSPWAGNIVNLKV